MSPGLVLGGMGLTLYFAPLSCHFLFQKTLHFDFWDNSWEILIVGSYFTTIKATLGKAYTSVVSSVCQRFLVGVCPEILPSQLIENGILSSILGVALS